jgi:hypothetical protein
MIRPLTFVFFAAGLSGASAVGGDLDVAPAPREIRADGSRDPAPASTNANKENPLVVVERIIKNSNAVGDKLARTDTGAETRGKQDTILKDIQSLIDQQENPPPEPDKNQDKSQEQNPGKKPDDGKMNDMMPMGGMNEPKNQGMGSGNEGEQPMPRRPRQQAGKEPMPKSGQASGGQATGQAGNKQPQQAKNTPPKNPMNNTASLPDPKPGHPKDPGRPLLPIEDEIVKEVWGHLPDKMRQQATQYYQQDFMPRYTELLKLYYSALAEKGGKR